MSDTYLRAAQILGRKASKTNPDRYPAIPRLLPISRSAWFAGVKTGTYPAPVKLGPKITAWRKSDIDALIARGVTS